MLSNLWNIEEHGFELSNGSIRITSRRQSIMCFLIVGGKFLKVKFLKMFSTFKRCNLWARKIVCLSFSPHDTIYSC